MQFLRISIATRMERNSAISLVEKTISVHGGWIIDHKLFSNMMATLNFELDQKQIEKFLESLTTSNLNYTVEKMPDAGVDETVLGQVSLSFIHSERDLKRDVISFG